MTKGEANAEHIAEPFNISNMPKRIPLVHLMVFVIVLYISLPRTISA